MSNCLYFLCSMSKLRLCHSAATLASVGEVARLRFTRFSSCLDMRVWVLGERSGYGIDFERWSSREKCLLSWVLICS